MFIIKHKWTFIAILIVILVAAKRANERMEANKANFLTFYVPEMLKEFDNKDIPNSVRVAVAILESNWGRSNLSKKHNNYFGIKKHKWNGKHVVFKGIKWRHYKDRKAGFKAFDEFIYENPRYKTCFDCNNLNTNKKRANCWAKKLHKQGYCPDDGYDDKLIKLMETYDLYKLDD